MSPNAFRTVWDRLEDPKTQPRRLRHLVEMDFREFREKVYSEDPAFAERLVGSFYSGDVYILKNAFPRAFLDEVRAKLAAHGRETPSSFHKMIEGCPNFHRVIDEELARQKKYGVEVIRHSFYFFPWNPDPFGIVEPVYERWRVLKVARGHARDEYERTTPKDGIVDRIQVALYPAGAGGLELHSDPYRYDRLPASVIMAQRGVDFEAGGVYFADKDDKKVDVEGRLDVGDMYVIYPTILHGVDTIDPGTPVDWAGGKGRWWMGLYTNASDHVPDRQTVYGVKDVTVRDAN
ncbi:MAG: hypothetical protein HY554_09605 [Elusimicrobia bacterium]|nr:hypothetical protein [Elusimicrobiota bacterium]